MKVTVNNEQTNFKDLYYEEGFWSGKRNLVYDGVPLTKIKRNIYEYKKRRDGTAIRNKRQSISGCVC